MTTKKTKQPRSTKKEIKAAKDRGYQELGELVTDIFNRFVEKEAQKQK
ncbi:MAG: hypothetical protein M0024_10430 [Nitrospiraceae bacterium]|nr:hypothetical protein [Nitrospiraceae bacterium]